MYHLIVVGDPEAYNDGPLPLERSRVLREFTSKALTERYAGLAEDAITELKRFPALFAYERANQKDARLGWITRIQPRHDGGSRFTYVFDETLPSISWDRLDALEWELDIGQLEMNRTHWALKDVDLFEILIEAGLMPAETLSAAPSNTPLHQYTVGLQDAQDTIEATPRIFRLPTEPRQDRLVSVMVPYQPSFESVNQAIREVCTSLGLDCQRAKDISDEPEVIQDIFSLIYRSAVVICDLSGRNTNVYYETGIAHTLGRHVVLLTQNEEHVSFDLRHLRFIQYMNIGEGLEELKPKLEARLRRLLHLPPATPS